MYDALWEFQKEDVDKLKHRPSVLIGSEMGTGKTHEAIALDLFYNPLGQLPTLVVAPLTTHPSWAEKYKEQSPDTDVVVIDRKNRKAFAQAVLQKKGDVFICHYEALRLMPELRNRHYQLIIADEVHRISNRKTAQTKALKKLKAKHKIGLSGTATGNNPDGLWSILNWLYPGMFSSYWRFRKRYLAEETKVYGQGEDAAAYTKVVGANPNTIDELHEIIDPFYVRHLKRERCCEHHPEGVMHWLPEKIYDTIEVEMSPTQKKIYRDMKKEMVAWIDKKESEGVPAPLVASVVIAQLVRLNMIAVATPVFSDVLKGTNEDGEANIVTQVELTMPSSKIEALLEIVKDHPDKQFLVLTGSKKAAYLAQEYLTSKNIPTAAFTGDTKAKERETMVKDFEHKKFRVMIGTIGAMGEGVDGLQHATDTAIFLDRAWSAVKNKQAEDRLHRGGQKNTVQIIDIVAEDSLDRGRYQQLDARWDSIRTLLGDKR